MKDLFLNISDEQKELIEDRLARLTQFISLCRQFPDGDMPEEVTIACRESANYAAFMIIDLCGLLTGMTEAQRAFMSDAWDSGMSFREVFEHLDGVIFTPETDVAEA